MQVFYGRKVYTWMESIGLWFLIFLTLIWTIVLQGTHVHILKKANIEFGMNDPNWFLWSWSNRRIQSFEKMDLNLVRNNIQQNF